MLKIIHKMGIKAIHVLLSHNLSSGPYNSSDSLEKREAGVDTEVDLHFNNV